MNFDSHTSGVVEATVAVVNALTPGYARGRVHPADGDLVAATSAALPPGNPVEPAQVPELARYAAELRVVFDRLAAGQLDDACELVNDLLRRTAAVPVLARHDGEAWHLHFHSLDAGWAHGLAGAMATALAVVLGNPSRDRLGVCAAPACDRVYVDVSRNGGRRFCSTACQNRVKAATFRERRR